MEIKASEIESIDTIGEMDGEPVKLIKCIGGFFMAIGRKRGGSQDEALASGSHAGIVKYNMSKNFSSFRPAMEKSELFDQETVVGLTDLIPQDLKNKGYEMYSLTKNEDTSYVFAKYGSELVTYKTFKNENSIVIMSPSNTIKDTELGLSKALTQAVTQEAQESGKENVIYRHKAFKVKDLVKK